MQTVIYADVLVAVNIFITYIMLVCTRVICSAGTRRLAVCVASFAGGFSSLIIFAGDIGIVFDILYKLLTAGVICLIAFLPCSFNRFLKAFASFFFVGFVFGGVCLALQTAFHPQGLVFLNGTVYFDVSISVLAVMCLAGYLLITVFDRFLKKRAADNTVYELTVVFRGKSASVKALYDTGNTACDILSGRPVTLADINSVSQLFSFEEFRFLVSDNAENLPVPQSLSKNFRLTVCGGIGGEKMLKAFLPDKITVSDGTTVYENDFCCIALTDEKTLGGEYGALLNVSVFERSRKQNENNAF